MKSLLMRPAPRNGDRILLHYTVYRWSSVRQRHIPDGDKWEECRWDDAYENGLTGTKGAWTPWCGNPTTHSTLTILDRHTLGWLPLPEED